MLACSFTATISVLGIMQSLIFTFEKSSAFWNIRTSSLTPSSLAFSMLFWMRWSKSIFVNAFSVASLSIFTRNNFRMSRDKADMDLETGRSIL